MRLEDIQRAVGDDTAGIAAFHDALNEYANACYEAYVAPSGTGVERQRMQESAERVTTALADGTRSWEQAVERRDEEAATASAQPQRRDHAGSR